MLHLMTMMGMIAMKYDVLRLGAAASLRRPTREWPVEAPRGWDMDHGPDSVTRVASWHAIGVRLAIEHNEQRLAQMASSSGRLETALKPWTRRKICWGLWRRKKKN